MTWTVLFHWEFEAEYRGLSEAVQDELLERLGVLREFGPTLGRPTVDTLKGSSFGNMKEIRFNADSGVWRFAFAFDPQQQAIVLIGGDKKGEDQKAFYTALIKVADKRFAAHVANLKAAAEKKKASTEKKR